MNFFLITGPPAVGKMTVGQAFSKRLGYKLFYNHHSIDLTLNFFEWGMPEFKEVNEGIRQLVFKTASESKNLKGFIFTLVWAFDMPEDWTYVEALKERFEGQGWKFHIVELYAPTQVRLERNETENRLKYKESKRDLEKSRKNLLNLDEGYIMNSDDYPMHFDNYLKIDNSDMGAEQTVSKIIEAFNLIDN